jgi:hypothetical protein
MAAVCFAMVMIMPSIVSAIVARVVSPMVVTGSAGKCRRDRDGRNRSRKGRET